MGELSFPPGIPDWMRREVADYDLPFAKPPHIILDIGANVGAFTLLAKQRWPHALVVACEPVQENADQFCLNVNGQPHVQFRQVAVRDFTGEREIFLGDRGVTCGFHQLGRQTANTTRVACEDAALLPAADFVKIDTEGCEVEIMGRLDLSLTQALAVEYHRTEDVALLKHLAELNDLKLWREQPLGDSWGLLVFARDGALKPRNSVRGTRNCKPFLAIPAYGGVDARFLQCLLRTIEEIPIVTGLHVNAGDSSVCRSRNTLCGIFLESDFTDLVFIDSDIVFSTDDVMRLLAHDVDIVGGFYPKKKPGPADWVYNGKDGCGLPGPDGLLPVNYMGTGFLRIRRQVFERMIAAWPTLAYGCDHEPTRTEHAFFVDEVRADFTGRRRYLTEDWNFCARCADLGIPVFGDTKILLQHVGTAVYPIEPENLSSLKTGNGTRGAEALRPSPARALSTPMVAA